MEEKSEKGSPRQPLLPTFEERRQRRAEEEALMMAEGDVSGDRWAADRVAFLTGFNLLSAGANLYVFAQNLDAGTGWYYLISMVGNLLGLYGVVQQSPLVILLFGCYLGASFMLSSVVAGGALLLLMRRDVCSSVAGIVRSRELGDFCAGHPTAFRALALGAVFGELLIELFVIYQLKKVHQVALIRQRQGRGEKSSGLVKRAKPQLGSIAIIEP